MSQTIETITHNHRNFAKVARAHKRTALALFLSLCDYLDKEGMTDKQKERARAASAAIGSQMLKAKEALPSDPSKLRMHVESIKQKCDSIGKALDQTDSYELNCQRVAILRDLNAAKESVELFLAEYIEHKANVANAA